MTPLRIPKVEALQMQQVTEKLATAGVGRCLLDFLISLEKLENWDFTSPASRRAETSQIIPEMDLIVFNNVSEPEFIFINSKYNNGNCLMILDNR